MAAIRDEMCKQCKGNTKIKQKDRVTTGGGGSFHRFRNFGNFVNAKKYGGHFDS